MHNKVSIYSIFIFILIVTGCVDDNIYENKNSGKIAFSAVSNDNAFTRGTPIITAADIPTICVYGYYTGDGSSNTWENAGSTATPSFFNGITITNSGAGTGSASWSYTNPVYWPALDAANVTFFAYSPTATDANGITITGTTGVPVLRYSMPTTTTNQPDLLVAVPQTDLNNASPSPVTFTMKHVLTCIGFQGIADNKQVESITISGISLAGDLSLDGSSISWSNLSSPDTTHVFLGINNDTLTSNMSTNLTAADGYLMLIPQTLQSGANITVKLQGEDARVFDLADSIWTAGQYIEYLLTENSITVTPSTISLSALGVDIDTLSITCIPVDAPWTLTSPVSWLKFSQNASGTDTTSTISGTGNGKIYIVVDPYMINSSEVRSASIYEGNEISDIKVTVSQKYMMNIPSSTKGYAGAFWRCAQKGERLIRIPADVGSWKASVFWMDDQWEEGDIILNASPFTWPAPTVSVGSDTPAVSGTATSITGNTNDGYVKFRIGLNNTYTASADYPARYALLSITWDSEVDAQFLFIRQGEDPDYVMRPTDIYGNVESGTSAPDWRPMARKISPFNMTADTLAMQCNRARTGANPSRFTDYPSQAGALFQWANPLKPRYAYSAVQDAEDWSNDWSTGYWSTLAATHESAPEDYPLTYGGTVTFRRPSDGSITGPATTDVTTSEIVQSLYYSPYSSVDNMIYAYIADGYFDRLSYGSDNGVNTDSPDAGYWGQLIYNPITKASIFIPYTGYLIGESGAITSEGIYINMWTSSAAATNSAIIWNYNNDDGGALLNNNRGAGFTIRAVVD